VIHAVDKRREKQGMPEEAGTTNARILLLFGAHFSCRRRFFSKNFAMSFLSCLPVGPFPQSEH
jgi:hypothetical protein